jgi:hypothetical protein
MVCAAEPGPRCNSRIDEPAMNRLLGCGSVRMRTMMLLDCGGAQTGDLSWFATS